MLIVLILTIMLQTKEGCFIQRTVKNIKDSGETIRPQTPTGHLIVSTALPDLVQISLVLSGLWFEKGIGQWVCYAPSREQA